MKSFYNPPENLKEDIEIYKSEIENYLKGELRFKEFRGKRVPRGVYEQRTDNTFMLRIRIPAGGITPVQLEKVSDLSRKFGNGILHITTRQDIQIHWVELKSTPEIMFELLEVGLTCRGGGGNTLRNITACYDAGVCEKEAFDVVPYNIALTEYLIKTPLSFTLPRKFKVAFSGCSSDCAFATVNDVGFIAAQRVNNGKVEHGFRVYVAGGMGAYSRVAEKLEEFVPADEIGNVTEAVMRLFDKHGNRKRKHKARLRFLFEKLGKEEFVRLYREELENVKKEGGVRIELRDIPSPSLEVEQLSDQAAGEEDDAYKKWFSQNLFPQKQQDFYYATIFLELGHISAEKTLKVAQIVRKYREGTIRATQDQNLVLRWLHKSELKSLYSELKEIGLNKAGAKTVQDISVCAGASTCRPGICLSRGLASELNSAFEKEKENLQNIGNLKINISGCPNACGQDPIGQIGLIGAARRIGDRIVPYYTISLGGRVEEGKTTLGEKIEMAPSKTIPSILLKFLMDYKENGQNSDFYEYIEKRGKSVLKEIIDGRQTVPPYEENKDYYFDWGAEEEFSLAGRGEGECGAGVLDMIEVDLKEAKKSIDNAEAIMKSSGNPARELYEAIIRSAGALLVTRGVEAQNDIEAFQHFEKCFINQGLAGEKFRELMRLAEGYKKGKVSGETLRENINLTKDLATTVTSLYLSMDDSLQFEVEEGQQDRAIETRLVTSDKEGDLQQESHMLLDLKGVKCPFNYVKAKLQLETMNVGELLELYLDDGEPIKNVPNSLKNDGQEILEMDKTDSGHFRLLVKKKA